MRLEVYNLKMGDNWTSDYYGRPPPQHRQQPRQLPAPIHERVTNNERRLSEVQKTLIALSKQVEELATRMAPLVELPKAVQENQEKLKSLEEKFSKYKSKAETKQSDYERTINDLKIKLEGK